MQQKTKTQVLNHFHEEGDEKYLFVPPEGFYVPYGLFEGKGDDGLQVPELMALVAYLEVDYEPEKGEIIEVVPMDDTIHEPTIRELEKLMIQGKQQKRQQDQKAEASEVTSSGLLSKLDKTQLSNLSDLIRSGMDGKDEGIMNLKPHEREAEGYTQSDVDDAEAIYDFGTALLADIAALMERSN